MKLVMGFCDHSHTHVPLLLGLAKECEAYPDKLFICMLALANAGVRKVDGCPAKEDVGADGTKFVEMPLDIVLAYLG